MCSRVGETSYDLSGMRTGREGVGLYPPFHNLRHKPKEVGLNGYEQRRRYLRREAMT